MKRALKIIVLLLVVVLAAAGYLTYDTLFKAHVKAMPDHSIYIKTTDSYQDLIRILSSTGQLDNVDRFDRIARQMKLDVSLKPGRYVVKGPMSYVNFVRMLRSGNWEQSVIKLKAEMKRSELIDYLASELQADSAELLQLLSGDWPEENGFTKENVYCIFIPDHYYFNWATTADKVVDRFYQEYQRYWTTERLGKAYEKDLSAEEACILASIVDGEAIHVSEMPTIAGLYLNRLKRNILLQADPTVLYSIEEEGRKRVLNRDLERDHPYNTYKIQGLPPGPIMLPDKRAIDAVLNAESHDYIYMCAKEDGSFYHYFTASYIQHLRNRAKYSRSLNTRRIFR